MNYRWECLTCHEVSAIVVLTPGQVPPVDAVARWCERCRQETVQWVQGAQDRRTVPRPGRRGVKPGP